MMRLNASDKLGIRICCNTVRQLRAALINTSMGHPFSRWSLAGDVSALSLRWRPTNAELLLCQMASTGRSVLWEKTKQSDC